jgi:type I restriction enzyme, R subunit
VHRKEQVVRAALFGVLQDADEVERIFLVIKQQGEY